MRHVAVFVAASLAAALVPASAANEAAAPTIVFASVHEVRADAPTPQTVADLFLLRGNRIVRRLTRTTKWEEDPAWSPDGSSIAFTRGDAICHAATCDVGPSETSIWVRALRATTARRITRGPFDVSPTWAPDGGRIAFARLAGDPDSDGIYTLGSDGRGQTRASAIPAVTLDWSPDGTTIAFFSLSGRLRLLDLDSGQTPRLIVTNLSGERKDIAWSPQGDRLAIATGTGLYVVGRRGGRARRIVKRPADGVSWSPDGRRLAFSTARTSRGRPDVFVVGAGGRGLMRLTTNPGSDFDPAWRP